MSREVNAEEAASWNDEEAAENMAYLESRARLVELARARQLRGDEGVGGDTGFSFEGATAKEVMEWVGEDPARAAQALEYENANEQRVKLTERLESVAAG